jgi:UDP-glucose 4-epimerase
MKKKAILITGVAGCLGANLAHWLCENHPEYALVGIDDLSGGYYEFVPNCLEMYFTDCGTDLDYIFEKYDIKIVYHAAAIAAEACATFRRVHYYTNNIVNSANVINHCIRYNVDRLVYFSSMAVYGRNETPFIESQVPEPVDPYGIGKYAVEMDLQAAKETHGLKWTIVRPHSVYGKYQNIWDRYRNVLGIWMLKTINGEPLSIYGDGSQQRAFTYVDDILEPLWLCGTDDRTLWQTFNIGNDEEMTILDAATLCKEVCGNEKDLNFLPGIHEVKNAFSDHTKAKEILGFECKTTLRDGLQKMWYWAKNQPVRVVRTIENFELQEGLYEMWKKK